MTRFRRSKKEARVGTKFQAVIPRKLNRQQQLDNIQQSRFRPFGLFPDNILIAPEVPPDFDWATHKTLCRTLPDTHGRTMRLRRRQIPKEASPKNISPVSEEDSDTTRLPALPKMKNFKKNIKVGRWTMNEDALLLTLVKDYGKKFEDFRDRFPMRTVCAMKKRYRRLEKLLRRKKNKSKTEKKKSPKIEINLTDKESRLLGHCVYKWGETFDQFLSLFPKRNSESLQKFWKNVKANVKWSPNDEEILKKLLMEYGCDVEKLCIDLDKSCKKKHTELDVLAQACEYPEICAELDVKILNHIRNEFKNIDQEELLNQLVEKFDIGAPRAYFNLKQHQQIIEFVKTRPEESDS